MNRDWFARTQPETDGKVSMLRRLPGPLFIDAHEFGGAGAGLLLPPNADPIYHEIADESVDWINNVYGSAMAAEFERRGIPFFNRDVYDLFYMGYGDTVPATEFIPGGDDLREGQRAPDRAPRLRAVPDAVGVRCRRRAIRKRSCSTAWVSAWREAYAQGVAGQLEPNEVVNNPGNKVQTQVPDSQVRNYFITERRGSKQREAQALVRRLQRMDVDAPQAAPLRVPDFTPYGRSHARRAPCPAGTWWVRWPRCRSTGCRRCSTRTPIPRSPTSTT